MKSNTALRVAALCRAMSRTADQVVLCLENDDPVAAAREIFACLDDFAPPDMQRDAKFVQTIEGLRPMIQGLQEEGLTEDQVSEILGLVDDFLAEHRDPESSQPERWD